MILDTSAVLAILFREAEADAFVDLISDADLVGIAAPTLVETGVVLGNKFGFGTPLLPQFLQEARVAIIPFGEPHWQTAISAYERYGKGRHPAKLNLGDCFSYAAAKLSTYPLLCKGNDFQQKDVKLAY